MNELTLCFAIICENGKNTIMVSDSLKMNDSLNLILSKTSSKIFRMNDGSLIAGSGTTSEINLTIRLYESPSIFLPSELLERELNKLQIDKFLKMDSDFKLSTSFLRILKDEALRLNIFEKHIDLDKFAVEFIILFNKDSKISLTKIFSDGSIYCDPFWNYTAIGFWESFEILARQIPLNINDTIDQSIEKSHRILDFYEQNIVGVGGKRHIEILNKKKDSSA